jgi:hypothetical protein
MRRFMLQMQGENKLYFTEHAIYIQLEPTSVMNTVYSVLSSRVNIVDAILMEFVYEEVTFV